MNPSNERMPYWFTRSQIDALASVVGSSIESGSHKLRSVNDEIGIAKARLHSSSVRSKISKLFREETFVLMLSQEECRNIADADIPEDIRGVVEDGL